MYPVTRPVEKVSEVEPRESRAFERNQYRTLFDQMV
jgi:hypothetical protein